MKNLFKKSIPKNQVPRTMEEITSEYSQLVGKVGQAQYQAYIYTKTVAELNKRLEAINQEAEARRALDKQSASAPAKEETANV